MTSARHGLALLLGLALFAAGTASAGELGLTVTPFGGFAGGGHFTDQTTGQRADLDNAAAYGVVLNFPADRSGALRELPAGDTTEWELFYMHQGTHVGPAGTALPTAQGLDVHAIQVGGAYIADGRYVRPYLAATIGATILDPTDSPGQSETDFGFSLGTGLRIVPSSRVSLRLEARGLGTVIAADSAFFCVSNGGATCAIHTRAEVLWQWLLFGGVSVRF
jgi:opacity protein-like surface antigen